MIGRHYLDPGDLLGGRFDPPRPVVVLKRWGSGGGPRNVLVRYTDDGHEAVIPFTRRLKLDRPTDDLTPTHQVKVYFASHVDEAIRPATTVDLGDGSQVARCDYCGNLFPIYQAERYWERIDILADKKRVYTTGIYCSEPCGEWATNPFGSSRG